MARTEEHLDALLKLPPEERAKAARALLDSLDEEQGEEGAEAAQLAELSRRMDALDAGEAKLVTSDEARARVRARLRALRGS